MKRMSLTMQHVVGNFWRVSWVLASSLQMRS